MSSKAQRMAPVKDRIRAAMGKRIIWTYHELMRAAFPEKDFPRAWRYAVQGGPPGCAMSFGRALREMGWSYSSYDNKVVRIDG